MIKNITFLHFLTAALLVEVFMLFLFRFTKSPFTGMSINKWYDNFDWSAIILDVSSVIIGFYLAKYAYQFLVSQNIITEENYFIKYFIILLIIQITHDFSFYFTVIKNAISGKNKILAELVDYAKNVRTGAVIGDSFMYLIGAPLLFYLSKNINNDVNSFISIVCVYLMGYFIYQKPIIKY